MSLRAGEGKLTGLFTKRKAAAAGTAKTIKLRISREEAILSLMCISLSFTAIDSDYIPFIYALVGYIAFSGGYSILLCLLMLPGVWLTTGLFGCVKLAVAVLLCFAFNKLFAKKMTSTTSALAATVFSLAAGVIYNELNSFGIIGWIYTFLEALLTFGFYFIYKTFCECAFNFTSKEAFSTAETICVAVVLSCCIGSLSAVSFNGINAALIAAFAALVFINTYFSNATVMIFSVISSFLLCLTCGFPYSLVSTFALCGVFAALSRALSKAGMCLATAFMAIFISVLSAFPLEPKNIVITFVCSSVAYFILDRALGPYAEKKRHEVGMRPVVMNEALNAIISEEIDIQKRMLESVSRNISLKPQKTEDSPVNRMCRTIAADVCSGCNMCSRCWGDEAADTYKCFTEVLELCLADPSINYDKLPNRFLGRCNKSYFLFKVMSYVSDADSIKKEYERKLAKFKALMVKQFSHINKVLDKLSDKLIRGLYVNEGEAHEALAMIQSMGIAAERLVITEDFNRKKKFFLKSGKMLSEKAVSKDIPMALTQISQRNVIYDYSVPGRKSEQDYNYTFAEETSHKLSVGVAGCSKENYEYSGDNMSDITVAGGLHIVALSDGMGSGDDACRQSARVLNMLEELFNAGSDETDCLDMINSILALEVDNEVFSTLDIFIYNMNSSLGEFVKAGACPTYIRFEDKISKIDFETLPVGILENMQIKKGIKEFKPNEYIYIMSDGFYECIKSDEDCLIRLIEKHAYRNPQKIAESLFADALEYAGGKAPDDITVIVAKVR